MAQPNQRVRVTRAFRHKGDTVGVGSVIDLDKATAIELRSANKIEFVQSDVKLTQHREVKRVVTRRTTAAPAPAPANPKQGDKQPEK